MTVKIEFDPEADALYIYLRHFGEDEVAETVEVDKGIYMDMDKDHLPIGIEVLGFTGKMRSSDFVNFAQFVTAVRPFLSVHELAHFLNVDDETIRRKVKKGEVPAVNLGGRAGYRIDSSRIRALFKT